MLNWDTTPEEFDVMIQLAKKSSENGYGDYRAILMDLNATHANGTPLDLVGLLNAKPADLAHDICGIRRHLNRTTGKLENCFSPRYSQ